jgi:hypothetical protein
MERGVEVVVAEEMVDIGLSEPFVATTTHKQRDLGEGESRCGASGPGPQGGRLRRCVEA